MLMFLKPSLGSCEVPTKYFVLICSAVLSYIGHDQTNKQTSRQINRAYIDQVKTGVKAQNYQKK